MFDWLPQGALPIGMLMFLGTLYAFVRRRAGHSAARRQYPALAEKLGLTFKPSGYRGAIGTISGTIDEHDVVIDPDDQRAIIVRFGSEPQVDLRSYEHSGGGRYALSHFRSGVRAFDAFFKTRSAGPQVAERLESADLERLIAPFKGRYYRAIRSLAVTRSGITCVFDFGTPPFIPASAVSEILTAMLELARTIESDAQIPSSET
jgi:hypothetical protein